MRYRPEKMVALGGVCRSKLIDKLGDPDRLPSSPFSLNLDKYTTIKIYI